MPNHERTLEELRKKLSRLKEVPSEVLLDNLSDRKRKEIEFHDRDRDRRNQVYAGMDENEVRDKKAHKRFFSNRKYYKGTGASTQYVEEWIKAEAPGRVFLDYACGNGKYTILAARAGAELAVGIDISPVSIENCAADAEQADVSKNTFFLQADCEDTRLPSQFADRIICSGMLHHLDLNHAFPELQRILAPAGKILAVEALNYNPIIKLYRKLTPEMRTEWESAHILSHKELRQASRYFEVENVKYWHLLSVLTPFLLPARGILNMADRLLTSIPGARLLAWMFTFELVAREELRNTGK